MRENSYQRVQTCCQRSYKYPRLPTLVALAEPQAFARFVPVWALRVGR
jgi:hypothetical protein